MVDKLTDQTLVLDLSGSDGNAYVVMGSAFRLIQGELGVEGANEYSSKARSGSYENVLRVTNEYLNLIDTSDSYPEVLDEYEVVTQIVPKG